VVCGLFLSSLMGRKMQRTRLGHGAPLENDLMEVLVLCRCRHDGKIEYSASRVAGSKMMCNGNVGAALSAQTGPCAAHNRGNVEREIERAYGNPNTSHESSHCEDASGSPEKKQ
jgi:hypothetical protein